MPGPTAAAAVTEADARRDLFGLSRAEVVARCGEPSSDDEADRAGGPAPMPCAMGQDPLALESPLGLTTRLGRAALLRLPGADLAHDEPVELTLGVRADPGGAVFAGASSLESRWTIEGAPAGSLRTGAAETRLPLQFLRALRVTSGGFAARDRASSGGVIDAELRRGGRRHVVEVAAWSGLQTERRRRPTLPGTFSVLRGRVVDPRFVALTSVASGPLPDALGGKLWYAVGLAPRLTDITLHRVGERLIDRDNDGEVDLDPSGGFATEPISRATTEATAADVPWMARVGLARPEQSLELTLVGQWTTSARYDVVATPEAVAVDRDALLVDGIATWRRSWRSTALRAQVAWHRSARGERAADARAGEVPQVQTAFVPDAADVPQEDPRFLAACRDDADDLYPRIPNCPILTGWYSREGVGLLTDLTADRPSFSAELVHQASRHALRAGVDGEDSRLVERSRYSGGSLVRTLFPGHLDRTLFVDGQDVVECSTNIDVPCPTLSEVSLTYRTREVAAFLQDTWRPRPDLVIDVGARWEAQQLGSRLRFIDNLAPRGGVAWDPFGEGRSRVAASFSRMFTSLPTGLGELIDKTPSVVHEVTAGDVRARVLELGRIAKVLDGTGPMITDEVAFSAEVTWPQLGALRLRTQHRWLRAGWEDTSEGFHNPAAASRRVDILGAELATSEVADLYARAGYAWGQARGSLVGAFDPRRGAILYNSSDFDEFATNAHGVLPSDLGHRFYAEVARRWRWRGVELDAGGRVTLASGRPQSVVGVSDLVGPIYLLPRGEGPRLPTVLAADLRLAARWRKTALSLQVQNLFNREQVTATNEVYANGLLLPIDGGDASDLTFLKSVTGTPARRSLSYGTVTSYQLPLVVTLGIEAAF